MMDDFPLDALWLKIERAENHLAHFDDLLAGRVARTVKPVRPRAVKHDPERQTTHYETTVTAPKPEWAIALGDVIHQLRSTLDHLICALARRRNPPSACEEFHLNFPIHKNAVDFNANWRVKQGLFARLLGDKEFAAIEEAQPYKRSPSDPTGDPLYLLSQLDNIDKHRAILILDNRLAIRSRIAGPITITEEEVEPGTKRLRATFPPTVPPHEVKVEDFAVHIVFAEPSLRRNYTPVGTLLQYIQRTVETVLDDFERFF